MLVLLALLTVACANLSEPVPNYIAFTGTWGSDTGASLEFYRTEGQTRVTKTDGEQSWDGTYVCISDHNPAQLDIEFPGQDTKELAVVSEGETFVIYENPNGNKRPDDLTQATTYRFQAPTLE